MILYGRDLSPYTRRVAIWAALQGRSLERRQLMVIGDDHEKLKSVHPQGRVPALQLDDGTVLLDSACITDWLEHSSPVKMLPTDLDERMDTVQVVGLSTAVAEKGVSVVYEQDRRPEEYHWKDWIKRQIGQLEAGMDGLESITPDDGFFGGANPNAADITAVCAYDFVSATRGEEFMRGRWEKLAALASRANAMPAFGDSKPSM